MARSGEVGVLGRWPRPEVHVLAGDLHRLDEVELAQLRDHLLVVVAERGSADVAGKIEEDVAVDIGDERPVGLAGHVPDEL